MYFCAVFGFPLECFIYLCFVLVGFVYIFLFRFFSRLKLIDVNEGEDTCISVCD